MNDTTKGDEKYRWAGPLLFTAVLVALAVLFVWFLSA
jgi:hypothetical protein